jgi:antitoxin ParD1/3/4
MKRWRRRRGANSPHSNGMGGADSECRVRNGSGTDGPCLHNGHGKPTGGGLPSAEWKAMTSNSVASRCGDVGGGQLTIKCNCPIRSIPGRFIATQSTKWRAKAVQYGSLRRKSRTEYSRFGFPQSEPITRYDKVCYSGKRGRTVNVSLTPELEEFVSAKVESGRYTSASEVVREALRLLEENDRIRSERLRAFNEELGKRLASLDRGSCLDPEKTRASLQQKSQQRRAKA